MEHTSQLGGVMVSMFATGSKFMGSNPVKAMDFSGNKNLQHTFVWSGSKATVPVL
jgi:hypothetical protein